MSNYKERLQAERTDLADKVSKLNVFITENEIFKSLSPKKQYLLRRQAVEMTSYLETLDLRISLEDDENLEIPTTKGDGIVGGFETFKYDERQDVFEIKEAAKKLVDTIEKFDGELRRKTLAYSHIETGQMFGVKSLFV